MTNEIPETGLTEAEETELNSLLADLDSLIEDQPNETEQELDRLLHDLKEEMEI